MHVPGILSDWNSVYSYIIAHLQNMLLLVRARRKISMVSADYVQLGIKLLQLLAGFLRNPRGRPQQKKPIPLDFRHRTQS